MASYKLNLAMIDGCPDAKELGKLIENYGMPEGDEFGVLHCSAGEQAVYATLVHNVNISFQKIDGETQEIVSASVEKVNVYPIGIFPARGVLEIYEGPAAGFDVVAAFLGSSLGLSTVVTKIGLDIPAAIEKIKPAVNKFQLRKVTVKDYAHNSYMAGQYSPKFLESNAGLEFVKEYVDYVTAATVSYRGQYGRCSVIITPNACLKYTVSNDDDKAGVMAMLRKLI